MNSDHGNLVDFHELDLLLVIFLNILKWNYGSFVVILSSTTDNVNLKQAHWSYWLWCCEIQLYWLKIIILWNLEQEAHNVWFIDLAQFIPLFGLQILRIQFNQVLTVHVY